LQVAVIRGPCSSLAAWQGVAGELVAARRQKQAWSVHSCPGRADAATAALAIGCATASASSSAEVPRNSH
jgi:hypothetical protein